MSYEELLANAFSDPKRLSSCVVGIVSRSGAMEKVVEKPLSCYHLYRGSLVDPHGTQIPLHRIACLSCEGLGKCKSEARCEDHDLGWAWAVVCPCEGGTVVRGPRGYDPVYALAGPPYPLVYGGRTIACVPGGECKGRLVKRDVWYWYY